MAYAIVQTTLEAPAADALGDAFAKLDRFTRHDGQHAAKDAYGVLAQSLSEADAQTLQAALADSNIDTLVVDEADLPQLGAPSRIRRALATENSLVLYDALGRESAVAWDSIKLIAVGLVAEEDFERGDDELILTDAGIMTLPGDHAQVPKLVRYVDLLRAEESHRYQIDGSNFLYDGLGDRMADDWQTNFRTLVGLLVEHATDAGAVLNRGARDMVGPRDSALAYPSRHAYEEEIEWLLWRSRRPSGT